MTCGEICRRKEGRRKITIECSRPLQGKTNELVKPILQEKDILYKKINPDLIAGIKITIDDEKQFDGSLATKLKKIFK